jgi:hypothetical protein
MSKPKSNCVFCRQPNPLTKSHIWPDWLKRVLTSNATHHERIIGNFATFTPKAQTGPRSSEVKQGYVGSRKPRNTCIECNGKWMRLIEEATMPFITELLGGKPFLLSASNQRLLATFLCLVSMRVAASSNAPNAINTSERDHLRLRTEPPPNWQMWIARYVGDPLMDERFTPMHLSKSAVAETGLEYCNAQVTTVVIGHLCANLVSTPTKMVDGYEGIDLFRIWPAGDDIQFQNVPIIGETVVPWLHEAFAREYASR